MLGVCMLPVSAQLMMTFLTDRSLQRHFVGLLVPVPSEAENLNDVERSDFIE
jgi:hypothetical protein